jgi:hypothetical protein
MSIATRRGGSSRPWQYHSRSDNHSKVACWTLLFDFLLECEVLRDAAAEGRIGFGINHVMVGPINKTLDLVVTVVQEPRKVLHRRTFADSAADLGIALSAEDRAQLTALPSLAQDRKDDVSEVAVALEAKACMTEHVKSLPRLHAEILATGYLAKRAAPHCISVSYSLINCAPTFVTPSGKTKINRHNQPEDARRVIDMIAQAVPQRNDARDYGYDVIGVTAIECRNDGSPVQVVNEAPFAPGLQEQIHYERMIRSLCSAFRKGFGR